MGIVDIGANYSIFSQVFHQLKEWPSNMFCHESRIFKVFYRGEGAEDAGGPYNETFTNICNELQSNYLHLLVPTSNNRT